MTLIRLVLILCGWLALILGSIGIIVPVLPTVPLYLLATLCFARSSKKLHDWFTATDLYKKHLDSYMKGEGMTLQTKYRITLTITVSMGIGALLISDLPLVMAFLAVIWIGLMVYFFAFVKTQPIK